MRHKYFGKKLSRTKNERRRLFQNLARELISHGSIKTTLAKARAVAPLVERLVTAAKRGNSSDINILWRELSDKHSVRTLLAQAKSRFANRAGGATRIIKLGVAAGDNRQQALLSFVDPPVALEVSKPKKEKKKKEKKEKPEKKNKKADQPKSKKKKV